MFRHGSPRIRGGIYKNKKKNFADELNSGWKTHEILKLMKGFFSIPGYLNSPRLTSTPGFPPSCRKEPPVKSSLASQNWDLPVNVSVTPESFDMAESGMM